jgi:hypothetical protein
MLKLFLNIRRQIRGTRKQVKKIRTIVKNTIRVIKSLAAIILAVICLLPLNVCAASAGEIGNNNNIYQQRTIHNPDGIGKFYMGREIAQVMGYQGAGWLERPSRGMEEKVN